MEKIFISLQAVQNFTPSSRVDFPPVWEGFSCISLFFSSKSQNFPARSFPFCLFFSRPACPYSPQVRGELEFVYFCSAVIDCRNIHGMIWHVDCSWQCGYTNESMTHKNHRKFISAGCHPYAAATPGKFVSEVNIQWHCTWLAKMDLLMIFWILYCTNFDRFFSPQTMIL